MPHLAIGSVEPAHEAHLHRSTAKLRLCLDDAETSCGCRGDRLLAEHGFARRDRGQDVFGVGRIRGCDDDRLYVIGRDQLIRIAESAYSPRYCCRPHWVGIADSDERRATRPFAQNTGVFCTHHPRADNTDRKAQDTSLHATARLESWIASTSV
jgi:hypothetical protein